ncbi:hypothetical protein [Nocardioides solisilvae]|uniref:hypothetical protein n=1 Tax=Nocardioides solisilvae TaxID=1542435 RepID=UPI000D748A05|nr:hypothetical protein [Nocardioides solisilvae]
MLALVLGLTLAGCGDDGPGGLGTVDDDAAWRTSTDPVTTEGFAWATGETVHLGDGTTIDTGVPVGAFVVAGDGVFVVPGESDDGSPFAGPGLRFAAPGADPVDTGLLVGRDGLVATEDGSTLVVLEADYDTGAAAMRFFDLATGEARTSTDGMEHESSDPVNELLESEAQIWGIDGETVHVATLDGDYVYDVTTGEGRKDEGDRADWPFGTPDEPEVSPDGRWRIVGSAEEGFGVVGSDGEPVALDVEGERWSLSWWVDEQTAVGSVAEGPGEGPRMVAGDTATLLSCVVPSGECTLYPESSARLVSFPVGFPVGGLDLRGVTS